MTSEEENQYTKIIDGILQTVDLETVTRKKIRMGLESALGGKDLGDQKVSLLFTASDYFRTYFLLCVGGAGQGSISCLGV